MKINYLIPLLLLVGSLSTKAQYAASNFTLIGQLNPEVNFNGQGNKYSGCWGWYQSSTNKEYAIAGSQTGTYWIDVTNPTTPTVSAFRAGVSTGATWREIKTYQNYCYVISDDPGTNRFQIFDMQYLPDSVSKIYDSQALFSRAHAAWVDGNKLYVSGVTYSNNTQSSMNVYSLANPTSPTLLRSLGQDYNFINYVHDMFVRNDTVFASCGYQGLYVFKFTSGNTFLQLGSLTGYPFSGYNHSSALTPNGQNLVFMDEVPSGLPIKVADVTNLANIQVLATTNQFPQTTPHNPFMLNAQYCLAASYQDGFQLYDISNPSTPTLSAYFDSYPQGGGNTGNYGGTAYKGLWGAYPWLPSKVIFGLDMVNGLFLLKTSLYMNNVTTSAFSIPSVICTGASFSPTNTSINAVTYTWTLNGPASGTSTLTSPGYTLNTPGVYSLNLLASNASFSSTTTKTILVTSVQATLSANPVSCSNCGFISSTVTGGTAPYTYTWIPTGASSPNINNLSIGCYTVLVKDANACSSTASICLVPSSNVGLAGISPADHLLIYPNPASQLLAVEHAGNTFNYRLYDRLGRLIISGDRVYDKTQINLDGFATGMYFLEVESSGQVSRHKVIIEH